MTKKSKLTIDAIAQELGVSKTTVSRAISGKGRISEATRSRVMDHINACNYRPNATAKSLAENRTYNLMLVLPSANTNESYIPGIWAEAFSQGYYIMVCYCNQENPAVLVQALDNRKVDGVILTSENTALRSVLKERKVPFAIVDSQKHSRSICQELLARLQSNS